MILLHPPCETCGEMQPPVDVACDKCQRVQKIEDFSGLILHFSSLEEDECDNNCDECEEDFKLTTTCEFHFCDIKCLSEYISDPNSVGFPEADDKGLALYCDSKSANLLFYALGSCDLSE
jgi:hypothetical protein